LKPGKLAALVQVTELRFQKEYEAVRSLIEEESRLRSDLAKLDSQAGDGGVDMEMQSIGADVRWQSWVAATRRDLNMQLARVLARKPHVMDRVRKAFGRFEATDRLWQTAVRDLKRRKSR
jgi:hypothetical protein